MLNGFNLEQHVSEATHKNGNYPDLLITRSGDKYISDVRIMPGLINPKPFDHYAIHSQVKLKKPSFEQKEITYRKLRAVNNRPCRPISSRQLSFQIILILILCLS